jgi:hypothetical protein
LADLITLVAHLMRRNIVQDEVGAIFGASQPAVSRRWGQLRPVIGQVLADLVPSTKELGAYEGS